ncbi:TrkA C-terminal domain-containing protein [Streptomyces sp. NPDC008121]|uniref:CASTOR/POLLUX-related putative ion channel n=1 Tax=Streptomyces sp. NPDC008121 TaxID=3364809 RepID=UPI0036E9F826
MAAPRASRTRSRLRYGFDNLMAYGTPALIGWLSLVCLAIVVPTSVVLVWADRAAPPTFSGRLAAVWQNVGRTLRLGGEVGPPLYVLTSVLLALVTLLFVSALVGLITTGLSERLLALRLGRSVVLEERHTVLLGWSDQVFPVVTELVAANANRRRAAVAVLADKDKAEMDAEIAGHVPDSGTTRVICRSGPTTDPTVVALVSPDTARAVLVLPPGGRNGDAHVVKTLLALDAIGPGSADRVVVAAVRDPRHHPAATLAAGRHGHVLSIDDIVARLLVQTSRQPGLSLVYQELLDFAGAEFYVVPAGALAGRPFGEALAAFATSSVVGLVHADGGIGLNPHPDTRITEGDRLIVITEDDDTARLPDGAVPSQAVPASRTAPGAAVIPEARAGAEGDMRAGSGVGAGGDVQSGGAAEDGALRPVGVAAPTKAPAPTAPVAHQAPAAPVPPVSPAASVDEAAVVTVRARARAAERLLLLGWNRRAPLIIEQLDQYVRPGSTLDVVALGDEATLRGVGAAGGQLTRLLVRHHGGDITEQATLAALDVPSYDSVMVIGDESGPATEEAETDDRTLVTLLHLRAIEESARRELPVITEMTDDRNRVLAPVREGADFIVSGRLISLLMTQIAENRHLAALFDELFSADGSEIHLKPATDYVLADREVTFATVVESARRRHECAIGYRLRAEASTGPAYGVRVNPDKRESVRFGPDDCVIVIAES